MKKVLCTLMALIIALSVCATAAEKITVTLNGEEITLENAPLEKDGGVFIALGDVCSILGFDLSWDNETKTAVVKNGDDTFKIPIGEAVIKKNGMPFSLPKASIIEASRTYVTIDALTHFGTQTLWDSDKKEISIRASVLDGKTFKIGNGGKVLSLEGDALNDGAKIILAEDKNSDTQLWRLVGRSLGAYTPVNKASSRAFDISSSKKTPGVVLSQYGVNNGNNQAVILTKNDDGTYLFMCKHSELYLTCGADGTITQEEFTGEAAQRFTLTLAEEKAEDAPEIEYASAQSDPFGGKFFSIVDGDAALSEDGVSDKTPSDLKVWRFTAAGLNTYTLINKQSGKAFADGAALEFIKTDDEKYNIKNTKTGLYLDLKASALFEKEAAALTLADPLCTSAAYEKDPLGGKFYTIMNAQSAVAVENDSTENSAKIVTIAPTDGDAQLWALVTQGGGAYVVTNKQSSRSIDVPGESKETGVQLTQYATNNNANQIFIFEETNGGYLLKNKASGLYVTAKNGLLSQEAKRGDAAQIFTLTEKGESDIRLMGAAVTPFLLKGEENVTNVKLNWNAISGATNYEIYRSTDGGAEEFLTSLSGNSVDDYDLEIGKSYTYTVYAISSGKLIDYATTVAVVPYALPLDLKESSNINPSSLNRPNDFYIDGVYYRFYSKGRTDGGSGFGSLWMSTSTDDITYGNEQEVLTYQEILANETCKDFDSCRFESQNFLYNPVANKFVFIAHFEADGGYGTARTSFASATPGERFTFHRAIRPFGDDTRDLNVFVDDDNSAYIMAAIYGNADLVLYKLNSDWSDVEKKVCTVNKGRWRELPSMIKVDGRYYLFSSGTAGWYPTRGMYNTATNLEGPWSDLRSACNTTTFSSQSGGTYRLRDGGTNYIMNTYRWMYYWKDALMRQTMNRRYPLALSNGFAFYEFFNELLYNWDNDDLVAVQNGRILSQGAPLKTDPAEGNSAEANDGNYLTYWNGGTKWPFSFEFDLGVTRSLSEVQISWFTRIGSEPYYQYKIEGSTDGVNYTMILDKTNVYTDYGFTADEVEGSARYVRVTVVNAKPRNGEENTYPAQIYEAKVLGK